MILRGSIKPCRFSSWSNPRKLNAPAFKSRHSALPHCRSKWALCPHSVAFGLMTALNGRMSEKRIKLLKSVKHLRFGNGGFRGEFRTRPAALPRVRCKFEADAWQRVHSAFAERPEIHDQPRNALQLRSAICGTFSVSRHLVSQRIFWPSSGSPSGRNRLKQDVTNRQKGCQKV